MPLGGRICGTLQYDHKFSYGTVVQLCVHVTSAAGLPAITEQWPKLLLDTLEKDSSYITILIDITNINRDHSSGFRLDTLTTHGKHGTPAVNGQDVLTTHTDYVNRYPSILQTTSYNFTGTKSTEEKCAGVVKA